MMYSHDILIIRNHLSAVSLACPETAGLSKSKPYISVVFYFLSRIVPLGNNIIERNQVVCKFPSSTTDADDRTVENVVVLTF